MDKMILSDKNGHWKNLDLQIGGIGKVTENILRGVFGINTCEEMLQKGSFLCALFSHSTSG